MGILSRERSVSPIEGVRAGDPMLLLLSTCMRLSFLPIEMLLHVDDGSLADGQLLDRSLPHLFALD